MFTKYKKIVFNKRLLSFVRKFNTDIFKLTYRPDSEGRGNERVKYVLDGMKNEGIEFKYVRDFSSSEFSSVTNEESNKYTRVIKKYENEMGDPIPLIRRFSNIDGKLYITQFNLAKLFSYIKKWQEGDQELIFFDIDNMFEDSHIRDYYWRFYTKDVSNGFIECLKFNWTVGLDRYLFPEDVGQYLSLDLDPTDYCRKRHYYGLTPNGLEYHPRSKWEEILRSELKKKYIDSSYGKLRYGSNNWIRNESLRYLQLHYIRWVYKIKKMPIDFEKKSIFA